MEIRATGIEPAVSSEESTSATTVVQDESTQRVEAVDEGTGEEDQGATPAPVRAEPESSSEAARQMRLSYELDSETGTFVVQLVDEETGDVVRQIPPEEVLELSRRLEELNGEVFDVEV